MPPMLRRLFTLLSALSLLLCVAVVVLWVRGFYAVDMFKFRCSRYYCDIEAQSSHFSVWASRYYQLRPAYLAEGRGAIKKPGIYAKLAHADPLPGQITLGYSCYRPRADETGPIFSAFDVGRQLTPDEGGRYLWRGWIQVPYWFVALASAVVPAYGAAGWYRRRQRLQAGVCRRCGYDLRATSGRCPECGTVPESAHAAA
jgi:hypothetical protein